MMQVIVFGSLERYMVDMHLLENGLYEDNVFELYNSDKGSVKYVRGKALAKLARGMGCSIGFYVNNFAERSDDDVDNSINDLFEGDGVVLFDCYPVFSYTECGMVFKDYSAVQWEVDVDSTVRCRVIVAEDEFTGEPLGVLNTYPIAAKAVVCNDKIKGWCAKMAVLHYCDTAWWNNLLPCSGEG